MRYLHCWPSWGYPIFMIFPSENHRNHPRKKTSGPPLELGVGSRISKIEMQHLRTIYCVALHMQILGTEYLFFFEKWGVSLSLHVFLDWRYGENIRTDNFAESGLKVKIVLKCFDIWNMGGTCSYLLGYQDVELDTVYWCFVNVFFELQVYDFDLPPTQDASHHNTFSRESL